MKFAYIEKIIKDKEGEYNWKGIVLTPLLLGLAFGTGCYVAKVILTSPLMNQIVKATAEGAQQKIDRIKT